MNKNQWHDLTPIQESMYEELMKELLLLKLKHGTIQVAGVTLVVGGTVLLVVGYRGLYRDMIRFGK